MSFRFTSFLLTLTASTVAAWAQPKPSFPNPYNPPMENWGQMPKERPWGAASGISIDSKGNLWILERCGAANNCSASKLDPVLEFDPSGKLLRTFGADMFVFPHEIFVDRNDHDAVWVTDGDGKDAKGHTVVKFSPEGKVLMTLGKQGVKGDGPDTFNRPTGVVVAENGDIFVSDGHGGDSNARVVKFSKDGKFIKAWGKKGSAPGDFDGIHGIAMDGKAGSSLPTATIIASRSSIRMATLSISGRSSDVPARSMSTTTT